MARDAIIASVGANIKVMFISEALADKESLGTLKGVSSYQSK